MAIMNVTDISYRDPKNTTSTYGALARADCQVPNGVRPLLRPLYVFFLRC